MEANISVYKYFIIDIGCFAHSHMKYNLCRWFVKNIYVYNINDVHIYNINNIHICNKSHQASRCYWCSFMLKRSLTWEVSSLRVKSLDRLTPVTVIVASPIQVCIFIWWYNLIQNRWYDTHTHIRIYIYTHVLCFFSWYPQFCSSQFCEAMWTPVRLWRALSWNSATSWPRQLWSLTPRSKRRVARKTRRLRQRRTVRKRPLGNHWGTKPLRENASKFLAILGSCGHGDFQSIGCSNQLRQEKVSKYITVIGTSFAATWSRSHALGCMHEGGEGQARP